MRNARFFDERNTPLAWTNLFDDVVGLKDNIEDATNAHELLKGVNEILKKERRNSKFHIDRVTDKYVRIVFRDAWGNLEYIKAWF